MRSDADLVRAARCGSRDALAELVGRHWDTAVFLAARVLGSVELGRDAAQEAAVAALTDLARLRSPERFGAWFCGIALNVSRGWLRRLRPEVPGGPPDLVSALPSPAEAAEAADVAARVRAAVAALAGGQRDAVLLFYLQGMSHREVAAELCISVGAVKSRLHQARAALAPLLAPIADLPLTHAATEGTTMAADTVDWVDVAVAEIRRTDGETIMDRKHVMVLRETGGERQLPVWIGAGEAIALALALESVETPRPFTYTLAASLVEAAGARLSEVRIGRLLDQVFYATIVLDGPAGAREVDARPSDAANLALATGVPIRLHPALFEGEPPENCGLRLAACSVATGEIAAEAQQRMRESWQRPGRGAPAE